MVRLAVLIIFCATLVGALMPSFEAPTSAPPPNEGERVIQVDDLQEQGSFQPTASSGTVTLERSFDGHFYADAQVNGAPVHFLVDTGATGIALSADDARRAGLVFNAADAEQVGTGASGVIMGHWVALRRVELGLKTVSDTPAVILEGGEQSLLGQSLLSKFGSVEIHGNTMVLR